MATAILIPLKDPATAKSRLAAVLSVEERGELVAAMLEDVARALQEVAAPKALVTNSGWAAAHAQSMGWKVLLEERIASESDSVDAASSALAQEGFASVLRLPADIPLIRPHDVVALLEWELPPRGALIVPSRDGTGTNALLRRPPLLFPARFGPNSRALHEREASLAGAPCMIEENERIGLDLDEPEDLASFLRQSSATETRFLLDRLGIGGRLGLLDRP